MKIQKELSSLYVMCFKNTCAGSMLAELAMLLHQFSSSTNRLTDFFSCNSCRNSCIISSFSLPLFFLKNLVDSSIIFSSLSGFGKKLSFHLCWLCTVVLLRSLPMPDIVMIFKFFEFNTSSFHTACRIFSFFRVLLGTLLMTDH
jgi:hypothetical protein